MIAVLWIAARVILLLAVTGVSLAALFTTDIR